MQRVVGVDQKRRVVGIDFTVGLERLILAREHLDPRMRHRAARRNAVELVGERAGRARAASNVCRSRAQNRSVAALRAPGAKFEHHAALRRPANAVRLCGNEALVVERQKQKRFDQLRLDRGRTHGQDRLLRENRRPLRHGPDIAREAEAFQVI